MSSQRPPIGLKVGLGKAYRLFSGKLIRITSVVNILSKYRFSASGVHYTEDGYFFESKRDHEDNIMCEVNPCMGLVCEVWNKNKDFTYKKIMCIDNNTGKYYAIDNTWWDNAEPVIQSNSL